MPLISIFTNTCPDPSTEQAILSEATALVAEQLGKPESITMAKLHSNMPIGFGGSSNQNAALFEIEAIELAAVHAEPLTIALCKLSEKRLETPAEKTFVKFTNVPRGMWGGNNRIY